MLHLISTGAELWQSGAMLRQSDPEHMNTTSVWTTLSDYQMLTLSEARFMDLDFTLWGMGIWSATMSSRQRTTKKHHWCATVKIWCSLGHRASMANIYSENQKHNPTLEVEKNNNKKSKISKRMARLNKLCVKQTKLNEGENDGEGG